MTTLAYEFGEYKINDGELSYRGEVLMIPPKEFSLLILFVKSRGSLLSKDEIIDEIWHGACISDESLTRCIYSLRRILGSNKHYIRTFYGRGYRFSPPEKMERKTKKILSFSSASYSNHSPINWEPPQYNKTSLTTVSYTPFKS